MNGVYVKDSIKLFGFTDGFKFWFRWSITDPIKIFYLKYIVAKPMCTYHGYFLCKPDCKAKKIYGRKNIFKYQKERNKQLEIESKTIIGSDDGICAYCGKQNGTDIIDDPNWDTLERWLVCKTCKEVIELQREISFPLTSVKRGLEINDRLSEISIKTGIPILNACIEKDRDGKYHSNSVTFIGEKQ